MKEMTDEQIKYMAERFLSWKLPENFNPDCGISAVRPNYAPNVKWEPTGTNLLDYSQADAMVRHMVEELPPARMTREEFAARFRRWEHIKFEYGRWTATHENYDCSWEGEEDGWVDNGLLCEGRTLEELADEIEAKEAEMTALAGEAATAAKTPKSGLVHEHATAQPERPKATPILPNKERTK